VNAYKVNEERYWQMQVDQRFKKKEKIKRVKVIKGICKECYLRDDKRCSANRGLIYKCDGDKYWCRNMRDGKIRDYIFVEVK